MSFPVVAIWPACVVLVFVSACSVRPRPGPPSPAASARALLERQPAPRPGPPPPVASARALLEQVQARHPALERVRGLARVSYVGPHGKGTARQAIALAAPDQFRLEVFSPFGMTALASCNGETLAAYFPRDKVLYRGQADPLTIARFTRVLLSAREVVNLLRGVPELPAPEAAWSLSFDRQHGWHRLELALSELETHRVWFEPARGVLRRWERHTPQGQLVSRVELSRYQQVQGQEFPFEISLFELSGRQRVTVVYEQVELGPVLPEALFSLGSIPGVQEVRIEPGDVEPRPGRP